MSSFLATIFSTQINNWFRSKWMRSMGWCTTFRRAHTRCVPGGNVFMGHRFNRDILGIYLSFYFGQYFQWIFDFNSFNDRLLIELLICGDGIGMESVGISFIKIEEMVVDTVRGNHWQSLFLYLFHWKNSRFEI